MVPELLTVIAMADGIYVAMSGAAARSEELDAIADNLANAQTPGFKASRPSFEAFLVQGAGDKAYTAAVAAGIDLRPGPASRTENPLDLNPEDGAFLAVALPNGQRAYTRDGRLSLDAQRRLVQDGHPVLDRSGAAITLPPGASARITEDGAVRSGDITVGELGLFRLSGAVDRLGKSLLVTGPTSRATPVRAQVRTGEVELGNGGMLDGMVQLVSAQRHFESAMQALQTYRTMDGRGADLGRVR